MSINWREGDRSEYLAQFAFSTVGFVAPVPRQEDRMLVDMFVHLNREEEDGQNHRLVPIGQTIAVQVKSNTKPIDLSAAEVQLIADSAIPWFIAVCDRAANRFDVFATIDRLFFRKHEGGTSITFDHKPDSVAALRASTSLCVGPPIAAVALSTLDDGDVEARRDARARFGNVLASWAKADSINISALNEGAGWVIRPQEVETNVPVAIGNFRGPVMTRNLFVPDFLGRNALLRLKGLDQALRDFPEKSIDPDLVDDLVKAAEAVRRSGQPDPPTPAP